MHGLSLNNRMTLDASLWLHRLRVHLLLGGQTSKWVIDMQQSNIFRSVGLRLTW